MPNTKLCQKCRHFLSITMPNGEPAQYFCTNADTKQGPNPIGFLRLDAPACTLFSAKAAGARSVANSTVFVIAPNEASKRDPRWDEFDRKVIKIAVSASTILGLLELLALGLKPEWISLAHLMSQFHF